MSQIGQKRSYSTVCNRAPILVNALLVDLCCKAVVAHTIRSFPRGGMKTTGSCQCGQVRYEIDGDALFTYACHCHTCQKRTGSAFSIGAVYPKALLRCSGELTAFERTSDAGEINTRFSCSKCGNVIYGIGASTPGIVKLQAGTLDVTTKVVPNVHIWTKHAQSWVVIPESARRFETQPESAEGFLK